MPLPVDGKHVVVVRILGYAAPLCFVKSSRKRSGSIYRSLPSVIKSHRRNFTEEESRLVSALVIVLLERSEKVGTVACEVFWCDFMWTTPITCVEPLLRRAKTTHLQRVEPQTLPSLLRRFFFHCTTTAKLPKVGPQLFLLPI